MYLKIESAESALRVAVANGLAEGLILGIDNCEQEGRPLSQLQQVYLARMVIMAYDNAIEACDTLKVEAELFGKTR